MFLDYIIGKFLFLPTAQVLYTPAHAGMEYEDVYLPTEDGHRLHGWFAPGSSDVTWLWFHGNGGNIGHRAEELALMRHRLGVNLFIFDYRGYGNSLGTPSERGTYQDARAALEYLRQRPDVSTDNLVYFGRSLGAAVAVELATAHPPLGMVLAAPFTSLRDMARLAFPRLPVGWLVGNRYNSLSRIPQVRCPLLVLHGEEDEIVPFSQGQKLFEAANPPKHFQALPRTGHNDTAYAAPEVYWQALQYFMDGITGGQGIPGDRQT